MDVIFENGDLFLSGFLTTIYISIFAAILSLIIGIVVAVLRVTPSGGLKVLAIVYTEFFRNTPFLVQALALYFGLPKLGLRLQFQVFGLEFNQSFVVGTMALALYTGAYVAETIRSGLLAIAPGQTEAARSLGLSMMQTLRLVIIPQAVRLVIPPLGNLLIALVKNSAVLTAIGLAELMYNASQVNNRTFRTFEVFTAVIIFYLVLTLPLGWLVSYLEKKLNPLRAIRLNLRGAR
ncbi:MAG: glutamine transporter permease [Chloroflexi bacterium]|jgi:putative glutamine transport system permease protein|nr:glutamine transporter permease [Chloroflexota bacterium]